MRSFMRRHKLDERPEETESGWAEEAKLWTELREPEEEREILVKKLQMAANRELTIEARMKLEQNLPTPNHEEEQNQPGIRKGNPSLSPFPLRNFPNTQAGSATPEPNWPVTKRNAQSSTFAKFITPQLDVTYKEDSAGPYPAKERRSKDLDTKLKYRDNEVLNLSQEIHNLKGMAESNALKLRAEISSLQITLDTERKKAAYDAEKTKDETSRQKAYMEGVIEMLKQESAEEKGKAVYDVQKRMEVEISRQMAYTERMIAGVKLESAEKRHQAAYEAQKMMNHEISTQMADMELVIAEAHTKSEEERKKAVCDAEKMMKEKAEAEEVAKLLKAENLRLQRDRESLRKRVIAMEDYFKIEGVTFGDLEKMVGMKEELAKCRFESSTMNTRITELEDLNVSLEERTVSLTRDYDGMNRAHEDAISRMATRHQEDMKEIKSLQRRLLSNMTSQVETLDKDLQASQRTRDQMAIGLEKLVRESDDLLQQKKANAEITKKSLLDVINTLQEDLGEGEHAPESPKVEEAREARGNRRLAETGGMAELGESTTDTKSYPTRPRTSLDSSIAMMLGQQTPKEIIARRSLGSLSSAR